jgi:peroxygenase
MRNDDPEVAMSALERHAAYFDPGRTGRIPWNQTYRGLRDLGVGRAWSGVLSTIINLALGKRTGGGWLTIRVANIRRGKHDSDTGIFDERGEFVPARFDALFESISKSEAPDRLTRKEFRDFMKAHGPQSAVGGFFSGAEAKVFFCVAADTTKLEGGAVVPAVRRRTLHTFYEGKLLPRLAKLRKLRAARAGRRKR